MRATSKPAAAPARVEHRVVAGAARAEAEVVADQHVARAAGRRTSTSSMKASRRLRGQAPGRSAAPRPGRCRSAPVPTACRAAWRCAPAPCSGGPRAAAKKSRGCGSNVSTQLGTPRCRASLSAGPAWPGGRGARRRSCRSSARRRSPRRGGGSRGTLAWRAIMSGAQGHPSSQRHLPGRQVVRKSQRAERAAVQRLDPVADRGHHALDLVVAALGEGQPQRALAGGLAGRPRARAAGRRRAPRRPAGAAPSPAPPGAGVPTS